MESNRNDFVEINSSTNQNEKLGKLTIWMYIWITFRSYILQNGFNFANFQGLGYANAIYPALKKIYGKTDALKEALLNNIEFFNSNPQTLPLITSVHLSLLANGQSISDARTIKMSLMGPLSGIGDSLSQFAILPLFSIIAIGFAQTGSILGPVVFLFGINTVLITIKILLGILGYRLGERAIGKIATQMSTIIRVSSMVGVTIISALAIRLTRVDFALQFSQRVDAGASGFHVQTISIAAILNNIMPMLAAGMWVIFIYFMVSKFKWSPYRVIVITILVGVTCGVFGILGI